MRLCGLPSVYAPSRMEATATHPHHSCPLEMRASYGACLPNRTGRLSRYPRHRVSLGLMPKAPDLHLNNTVACSLTLISQNGLEGEKYPQITYIFPRWPGRDGI